MANRGDAASPGSMARRDPIEAHGQAEVRRLREPIGRDRHLAAPTLLEPVGTPSEFSLVGPGDHDVSMPRTEGTPLNPAHRRGEVAALWRRVAVTV